MLVMSEVAVTTSEIAGACAALDPGAPIEANDVSIARILGKRPVLWVGAGLSIAAGYPSMGALLDALVAAADDPIDRTRPVYEVVDAVVASVRAGRVRDVLQGLFQPARPATPLHQALARLAKAGAFAAIVTTNYDDLVERALAAEAAPFVLQPLEDNDTVTGEGVRLLKIHGSHDAWAKVVLSGRSYQEFGARNPFLSRQLDVLLRQQPILFVGRSKTRASSTGWRVYPPPLWRVSRNGVQCSPTRAGKRRWCIATAAPRRRRCWHRQGLAPSWCATTTTSERSSSTQRPSSRHWPRSLPSSSRSRRPAWRRSCRELPGGPRRTW
jgi:hypothetical protein